MAAACEAAGGALEDDEVGAPGAVEPAHSSASWDVDCSESLSAYIATPYDATHGTWKTKTVFLFTLTNIINSRLRNQYVLSPPSISPETFAYGSLPIPPSSIKLSCFFLIRKRHVPT